MPKRFTDSDKWDDPWFCELSNNEKLLWLYVLDACDHAGIWKANVRMLNFILASDYTIEDICNVLAHRIEHINNDKYFLPKFVQFQYPKGLNEKNRAHLSVINLLKKHNLFKALSSSIEGPSELNTSTSLGLKDKDKDKDKGKDMVKDKDPGPLSIDDLMIHCYVGDGESGAFEKLFKPFSRQQGLRVIKVLSDRRERNDQKPRPCMSDLAPYFKENFHQIKEQP